jgi:hypothetical protein
MADLRPTLTDRATTRTVRRSLARIADGLEDLPPTAADFLENQQRVTVKAALRGKDLAGPVTVEIELVDEINAREKRFRRWLIGLELHNVRAHCRALLMSNQK